MCKHKIKSLFPPVDVKTHFDSPPFFFLPFTVSQALDFKSLCSFTLHCALLSPIRAREYPTQGVLMSAPHMVSV